jgi:hypothetical protein
MDTTEGGVVRTALFEEQFTESIPEYVSIAPMLSRAK